MRIATWNVNSLAARLVRVTAWLEHAKPDVLLMQETKLADADAPHDAFRALGYELAHHGEGRWNGVAIASRVGIGDVVTNFGAPLHAATGEAHEHDPLGEARMITAVCGGVRVISVYVPNGRQLGTEFYQAKLGWLARLERWLRESYAPSDPLVLAGDLNLAPEDRDVWDPSACAGGTHVSEPERAAFRAICAWGLVDAYRAHYPTTDRYTWWDYRAGMFHKNFGMRIDHVLVTAPLAPRVVWVEIDREARKGKPTPSDHAPLLIDLDEKGVAIDAGWDGAEKRIAARVKK